MTNGVPSKACLQRKLSEQPCIDYRTYDICGEVALLHRPVEQVQRQHLDGLESQSPSAAGRSQGFSRTAQAAFAVEGREQKQPQSHVNVGASSLRACGHVDTNYKEGIKIYQTRNWLRPSLGLVLHLTVAHACPICLCKNFYAYRSG